ncbi:MAG: glycosyltransferase [Eubacteriales bacterium]|nr:glycosyltransferase [Eubacteriales bacterium]
MNDDLVSVIVPVYMVEDYLKECIDSIINQSYKNLEIILVDDGSKDKSSEICDEYALNDCRVRVVHKKNGGLSSARNAGLDICRGEYIAFVDSDDFIHREFINAAIYAFKKFDNIDIVQEKYVSFKCTPENKVKNVSLDDILIFSKNEAKISLAKYIDKITNISWDKVYKRELFSNIRFPEGRIHEDEFTTYKLLELVENVAYINQELYFYRQRENSIKNEKFNLKRLDTLIAFEERLEYYLTSNQMDLYTLTLRRYLDLLIYSYFSMKKARCDDLKEYIIIEKKIRKCVYTKMNYIGVKCFIKGNIFLIFRNIYFKIWRKKCNY